MPLRACLRSLSLKWTPRQLEFVRHLHHQETKQNTLKTHKTNVRAYVTPSFSRPRETVPRLRDRDPGGRLPVFSIFPALVSLFCRVPCFQGEGEIWGDSGRAAHLQVEGEGPGFGYHPSRLQGGWHSQARRPRAAPAPRLPRRGGSPVGLAVGLPPCPVSTLGTAEAALGAPRLESGPAGWGPGEEPQESRPSETPPKSCAESKSTCPVPSGHWRGSRIRGIPRAQEG